MKAILTRSVLIWTVLIVAGLFLVNSSDAGIDPRDVAGLWLFDEEGDEAEDLSGNGNNGSIVGNAEWVEGKFGKALEFDGTNYVSVPTSDSLCMTEEVTVMFCVRTEKEMVDMWNDRQAVVGKHFTEYEVGIYMDGQIHTYTSDGAGDYDEGIMTSIAGKLPSGEGTWELGKWYHIAWTLNGSQEVAYVDGIKLGEHTKAHAETKPGVNPLEMGQRVGGSLRLIGAIDEVIILNVALEEEDIILAATEGLEKALGMTAVSATGKLAAVWGDVKNR